MNSTGKVASKNVVEEYVNQILENESSPEAFTSKLNNVPATEREKLLAMLHAKNPPVLGTGTVS